MEGSSPKFDPSDLAEIRLYVSFMYGDNLVEGVTRQMDHVGAIIATSARPDPGTQLRLLVTPAGDDGRRSIRAEVEVTALVDPGYVAVRWLRASCSPDPRPLREFLQGTLMVQGGFVEIADLGGGRREFLFQFPTAGPGVVAEMPNATLRETPAGGPTGRPAPADRAPSMAGARRVKVSLPAVYAYGGAEYPGELVRLSPETVCVQADGCDVPEVGTTATVTIAIRNKRDRSRDVQIEGDVVRTQRDRSPPRFDLAVKSVMEPLEGMFEAYVKYLYRQAGHVPNE